MAEQRISQFLLYAPHSKTDLGLEAPLNINFWETFLHFLHQLIKWNQEMLQEQEKSEKLQNGSP